MELQWGMQRGDPMRGHGTWLSSARAGLEGGGGAVISFSSDVKGFMELPMLSRNP